MKKLIYSLCLLVALPAAAQTKTFTAACLNVDGLPPTVKAAGVYTVNLNKEGPQSEGTKKISKLVSQKTWDFFGVSENFNYNDELMSEIRNVFNCGTYRGKIPTSVVNVEPYLTGRKWFDTDGLNLLWNPNVSVSDESWHLWGSRNGITSDGADHLIAKGFRHYVVSVGPGMEIDVYIHHMDAETSDKDNAARVDQMNQLADMILASDNKRPILIMGDSNCRYTRDPIEDDREGQVDGEGNPYPTSFFTRINSDSRGRFRIHDPWIDFKRGGQYPKIGDNAIMVPSKFTGTNSEAYQTGEVVDKIWWIENLDPECTCTIKALDYLQDTAFTDPDTGLGVSDHFPIVVNFEITKIRETLPTTDCFIRNKGTGKFIAAGHSYGTQAIVAKTGNRVAFEELGNNNFKIRTTLLTNDGYQGYLGKDLYMDQGQDNNGSDYSCSFTFTYDYDRKCYNIANGDQYIKANGQYNLEFASLDSDDMSFQWEVVTQQELLEELKENASKNNGMDATFMIKGANFSRNDTANDAWIYYSKSNDRNTWWRSNKKTGDFGPETNFVAEVFQDGMKSADDYAWNLKQEITELPNGTYKLFFNGFRREGNAVLKLNDGDVTYDFVDLTNLNESHKGKFYSEKSLADGDCSTSREITYKEKKGVSSNLVKKTVTFPGYVPHSTTGASKYFDAGYYGNEVNFEVKNGTLKIEIDRGSYAHENWTCFDNFQLTYYGPTDETLKTLERINTAIQDAKSKATNGNLTTYNNKSVETAYNSRRVSETGDQEVYNTYIALANASVDQDIPAEMPYAIMNNSFEVDGLSYDFYDLKGSGWNFDRTKGRVLKDVSAASHGNNYFSGDAGSSVTYKSEVRMPSGLYEAIVDVTPGSTLKAGDYSITATGTANEKGYVEAKCRFLINGTTATITVENASSGFKADNFRLKRLNDEAAAAGYELVQLAINDATARLKGTGAYQGKGVKNADPSAWDNSMKPYQQLIDELKDLKAPGTGETEFLEIYNLLRSKVYAQGLDPDNDFTHAIINNSFDLGAAYGWDVVYNGDTGVKLNSDNTYKIDPCDGDYLFNTWQDGRGTIISQTITNLPAGKYKVTFSAANDPNKYVYVEIKGMEGADSQKEKFKLTNDKDKAVDLSFDFSVGGRSADVQTSDVTISFGGCNSDGTYDPFGGDWYKIDNVRLTYVGDADKCFFYRRLNKVIEEVEGIVNGDPKTGEPGLPVKYQNDPVWKKKLAIYKGYVKDHLEGHVGGKMEGDVFKDVDPLNSNGLAEIDAIYAALRELVFKQTETGANMTGAIKNNSFELGEPGDEQLLIGWTSNMETNADAKVVLANNNPPYTTDNADGEYLFNCWKNASLYGGNGKPVYQTIPNMPAGKYKLKAKLASDAGNKFYLGANDKHNEVPFVAENISVFQEIEFIFEVPVEAVSKDVTIGLYPAINDEFSRDDYPTNMGAWYKVDDFRLELVSRYLDINWEMETDTHGTIMLPFAVSGEELNRKGLEAYTIEKSTESLTPADAEINVYRLLKWIGPHKDGMSANVPYVLKKVGPNTELTEETAPLSIRSEEDVPIESNTKVYTFRGYTSNEKDKVKNYLLTGTLVEIPATSDQHHLQQVGDNVGFVIHADADDNHVSHETVQAYHAYMYNPIDLVGKPIVDENGEYEEGKDVHDFVTGFYFQEPMQDITLNMEAAGKYGTLILPFEAELPIGLTAYRVEGVKPVRNWVIGDPSEGTYQVIEKKEIEPNSEGKVILEKNTPYLIEGETSTPVIFSGRAQNVGLEENSPANNLLTGLFVSRDGDDNNAVLENGHWVLSYDNENDRPVFVKVTADNNVLKAYNAYIAMPSPAQAEESDPVETKSVNSLKLLAEGTEDVQPQADVILLEEPPVTLPWTMDNQYVGTLMLPFDVDSETLTALFEPYDMTASTINIDDGIGEWKETANHISYRVIQTTAATSLTANTAYLVLIDSIDPADRGDQTDTQAEETTEATPVTIEFTGQRVDDETPVTTDNMLGVYENTSVAAGNYVACAEKYHEFKIVPEGGTQVAAYHAYIPADRITSEPSSQATYLVLSAETVGVEEIMEGEVNVDIYTLDGVMVRRDVNATEALQELDHGIYILRSAKGTVKVIK